MPSSGNSTFSGWVIIPVFVPSAMACANLGTGRPDATGPGAKPGSGDGRDDPERRGRPDLERARSGEDTAVVHAGDAVVAAGNAARAALAIERARGDAAVGRAGRRPTGPEGRARDDVAQQAQAAVAGGGAG